MYIVPIEQASQKLNDLVDRAVAGELVAIALSNEHLIRMSPIIDEYVDQLGLDYRLDCPL
ncbi:MAG: hypothetical protein KDB27_00730 [Planctomycetales bacterium]|nr:hypothetical protein [Planctomycetales bacterium]